MIQRRQTLFLFLGIVALLLCLFFPVLRIDSDGMGGSVLLFNIGQRMADGTLSFSNWPMFALLAIACAMSVVDIFLYKKRKLQAKVCLWSVILCLAWYAFVALVYSHRGLFVEGNIHIKFSACLPLVAIIFFVMAYKRIIADEKLVRAADRIR